MVAVAQDARSQTRNRELALQRLAHRLAGALAAAAPAPPDAAHPRLGRRRRLDAKRRQAERKRDRRRPATDEG